ncbi:cupin domain-containing protein [Glaciecola sp. MH2013]|uniref:ChrR family anti-sigma-E factor n=1 Tax=Glaciecola sp. MH2013 TaxID=2785524 RepID=UPI00189E2DBE|nr:ChrR family anti-sigma-E factor [Glaciecola sp. MH2013]MBF7074693.1 cupin domain-containing protein [Glaciecola sp. MH2013]
MIKFHPTNEQLSQFADGLLGATEALMVSAHCDMCERCMAKVELYTDASAEIALPQSQDDDSVDFGSMMHNIMQEEPEEGIQLTPKSQIIELDGRTFEIPRTLTRYTKSMGNWSRLVGKLWQAPVDIGGETVANFIYMEKGGSVPEHTHRGSEMTLVINGEFSDGIADYDSGDFMIMDCNNQHTPSTNADEGCLVFSIVDKPLHFTSGWARLINPFSHLFFK